MMIDPYDFVAVMEGLIHAKGLVDAGVMTKEDYNTLYKHMMRVLLSDMKDTVKRNLREDTDDEEEPESILKND